MKTKKSPPTRAVAYVRTATDNPQQATEQMNAIRKYATRHGMKIVRTYFDKCKSGLTIRGRDAFAQMIATVQSGNADFTCILIYDISRWGRFQDADESACGSAGRSA